MLVISSCERKQTEQVELSLNLQGGSRNEGVGSEAYVEELVDSVLFEVLVDLLDAAKVLTVDAQLLHLHGDSLQLLVLAR